MAISRLRKVSKILEPYSAVRRRTHAFSKEWWCNITSRTLINWWEWNFIIPHIQWIIDTVTQLYDVVYIKQNWCWRQSSILINFGLFGNIVLKTWTTSCHDVVYGKCLSTWILSSHKFERINTGFFRARRCYLRKSHLKEGVILLHHSWFPFK